MPTKATIISGLGQFGVPVEQARYLVNNLYPGVLLTDYPTINDYDATGEIIVNSTVTLTQHTTVTAPLTIQKGGSIVTAGYTLTVSGSFKAGLYQVFTAASGEVVFGKGSTEKVYPQWWGAVPDQSTDCGVAIGKAIASVTTNGGNVAFTPGSFLITTQIALANVSNVTLSGPGTIYLNAEAAEFELSGTSDRLVFDGITFQGPGTDWTTPNAVINSASGQTITNLTIRDCIFKSVPFGVHLNANLSGAYENPIVENCRFYNMVGTASGHGLGLVMAGPSGRFVGGVVKGCTFEKCNRHSLYCEAVTSVTIVGCSFYKHRTDQTTTDSPFYSALNVARSRHVSITGCVFDSCNDLCVQLYQDDGTGAQDCGPYSVTGCTFRNSKWRDLLIGSDTPDSPIYPLNGVIVAGNTFIRNGTEEVSAIYYSSGTEVDIHDNVIYAPSQTDTTALMTVYNAGESSGRSGNVKIHDNIIRGATTSGTIRCISLASEVCTGTRLFEIYDNLLVGDYDVFYPVTVTNLNLQVSLTNANEKASGTYTPTRSAESNLDSNANPSLAQYLRIGDTVTVSGKVTLDPTSGGGTYTSFEFSLPIPSDIQGTQDLAGIAFSGYAMEGAEIAGVVANNTAGFLWKATDTSSRSWVYMFTYRVR